MEGLTGVPEDGERAGSTADQLIGAVRELISLMGKGGITELDLSTGEVSIRLRGGAGSSGAASSFPLSTVSSDNQAVPETPEGHVVTAPMIGTYYAAPSPGDAAFVQVGDEVEVGQAIGIIEAMKIMNEIIADRSGIVLEVLVENAQPVEYGSPLLRLGDQAGMLA